MQQELQALVIKVRGAVEQQERIAQRIEHPAKYAGCRGYYYRSPKRQRKLCRQYAAASAVALAARAAHIRAEGKAIAEGQKMKSYESLLNAARKASNDLDQAYQDAAEDQGLDWRYSWVRRYLRSTNIKCRALHLGLEAAEAEAAAAGEEENSWK